LSEAPSLCKAPKRLCAKHCEPAAENHELSNQETPPEMIELGPLASFLWIGQKAKKSLLTIGLDQRFYKRLFAEIHGFSP
jgi:hypothetical protein